MEEKFFALKTKDAETVSDIKARKSDIVFSGINVLKDELVNGQIVFINLGGDNPPWDTGLTGIAVLSKEPYDIGYEKRNFRINVDMKVYFSTPITREDLVPYGDTYGIIGIAPITKWEPNQALTAVPHKKAIALIRAIMELRPESTDDIESLFSPEIMEQVKGKTTRMVDVPTVYGEDIRTAIENKLNNNASADSAIDEHTRSVSGSNILLYGVPGSGKSWTIEHEYCVPGTIVERLVFHPDYTYSDFVGQILPDVDDAGFVTYRFTPGPFTNILHDAYNDPSKDYVLVIEEINRGNAPAIFGEIFQLLDRLIEGKTIENCYYPAGTSEYGITNRYIAESVYNNPRHKVRIPSNLSIIGTMNTSDQNVFTLDTAFQRRWNMRLIENNFDNVRESLSSAYILDTKVTWKQFCTEINRIIVGNKTKMASAEDKRLGIYFVHENDLILDDETSTLFTPDLLDEYNTLLKEERMGDISADHKERLAFIRKGLKKIRRFPEKVIKYLWDDAFKFNPQDLFETSYESLEDIIKTFVFSVGEERFSIFKKTVRDNLYPPER